MAILMTQPWKGVLCPEVLTSGLGPKPMMIGRAFILSLPNNSALLTVVMRLRIELARWEACIVPAGHRKQCSSTHAKAAVKV